MTARAAALLAAHEHPVWEDFGPLSWTLVGVAALFSGWVIWKAVRYTLDPGEEEADHIKRMILQEPGTVEGPLSSESDREADPKGSEPPTTGGA